jgi:hypothetical protein
MFITIHSRDRAERTTVNNDILEWCLWLSMGILFNSKNKKGFGSALFYCFLFFIFYFFFFWRFCVFSSLSVVTYVLFYDTCYLHW